ncbi:PIG-X-domain-containing protein [Morchella conica CCBAS932]|uniref:Protein PBN1 n=1 Tax=Morchella conica CCBAS932 TaxID=1392247 RepID=A0A3N4L2K2_9PEZI|nr:PIG-X-domain-containing protein [Morchella conica CCBAS932]
MRERITFIVSHPSHTHPDNFELKRNSLTIKALPQSAREDRLTFDIRSLPKPIQQLLKDIKEAHLRWSSGRFYQAVAPYSSRVPAGLHILTKPGWIDATTLFSGEKSKDSIFDDSFLSAAFDLHHFPKERLAAGIFGIGQWPKTFYSPVESIAPFRAFLQKLLMWHHGILNKDSIHWMERLEKLDDADYIDLKYDAISQKFEASIFWGPGEKVWSETLEGNGDVEVGVMGVEKGIEEDELKLAGFIYEIGESKDFEPTLFSFPSRHHTHPSTFTLTIPQPTGLHPRIHISLPGALQPPQEECTLNAHFNIPSALFVDVYQLGPSNTNLLNTLNIKRVRDVSGNTDLEKPDYSSQQWGSRVLIEIDTESKGVGPLKVELPLHLRYLNPRENSSSAEVVFAWPTVFWACKSDNWVKMGNNPFDRTNLGWEDLFPEQVMYYHLSPTPAPVGADSGMVGVKGGEGKEGTWGRIQVPVLDKGWGNSETIKTWTAVIVVLGFLWVFIRIAVAKIGKGMDEIGFGTGGREDAVEKKKK